MFIIKPSDSLKKTSKSALQVFKLFGKWGATSINGNSTCFGFQYSDSSDIFENLLKQGYSSYEISPGPTIRVSSQGKSTVWADFFSMQSHYEALDESSWNILSPKGKKECVINLVYQGDQYVLIDSETGNFICYLYSLNETLQQKFLSLCEKYRDKYKVSN